MIITFCGHSTYADKAEDEAKILAFLEEKVGDGEVELYLGEYGSFDSFARRCCEKYKKTHPNARLIWVTPYITIDYQKNYLEPNKKPFDEIIYPAIEDKPLRFAVSYRNKWMVDRADYVVAYITRETGGAYKTYQYALRKKKPIFNIAK